MNPLFVPTAHPTVSEPGSSAVPKCGVEKPTTAPVSLHRLLDHGGFGRILMLPS